MVYLYVVSHLYFISIFTIFYNFILCCDLLALWSLFAYDRHAQDSTAQPSSLWWWLWWYRPCLRHEQEAATWILCIKKCSHYANKMLVEFTKEEWVWKGAEVGNKMSTLQPPGILHIWNTVPQSNSAPTWQSVALCIWSPNVANCQPEICSYNTNARGYHCVCLDRVLRQIWKVLKKVRKKLSTNLQQGLQILYLWNATISFVRDFYHERPLPAHHARLFQSHCHPRLQRSTKSICAASFAD